MTFADEGSGSRKSSRQAGSDVGRILERAREYLRQKLTDYGYGIERQRKEEVETDMTDVDLIRCHICGSTNRVPRAKVAEGLEPVCGRC